VSHCIDVPLSGPDGRHGRRELVSGVPAYRQELGKRGAEEEGAGKHVGWEVTTGKSTHLDVEIAKGAANGDIPKGEPFVSANEEVEEYPRVEVSVAGEGHARAVARNGTCSCRICFLETREGVDEEGEDSGVGRTVVARVRGDVGGRWHARERRWRWWMGERRWRRRG
jgi:hypothetical protein